VGVVAIAALDLIVLPLLGAGMIYPTVSSQQHPSTHISIN